MVVMGVLLHDVNIVGADENTLQTPGERRAQVSDVRTEEWFVETRGSRQDEFWWQLSYVTDDAGVNIQRWCRGATKLRATESTLQPARSPLPVCDKEPELCIRHRRLRFQHPRVCSRQLEVLYQSVTEISRHITHFTSDRSVLPVFHLYSQLWSMVECQVQGGMKPP